MSASNIRSRKRLRRLRHVLVLLAALSLGQYLTTGSVQWPAVFYQQVAGALADYATNADSSTDGGVATAFDLSGRVVRVADGDTVTILDRHNTQHKVRLYGIDTPERNQPFGKAAKNALMQLIDNKPVGVVVVTTDKYHREVGTLYRDGVNVNVAMVAAGYAWWYEYYALDEYALQAAEQQARKRGLGLWADPHPVAPWDWRRKQR